MDPEECVTNFWRQYQRIVNDRSITLGDDYIDLNYDGGLQPAGSLSLYFRAFNLPDTLFDGPHIGYQSNLGEAVLYVPKAHRTDQAMKVIERSCIKLVRSGETSQITETEKETLKLIIEISPIRTIANTAFQDCEDIAKLSYEKVVKLYKIARKAFPEYRPAR